MEIKYNRDDNNNNNNIMLRSIKMMMKGCRRKMENESRLNRKSAGLAMNLF
jgi:hypothetical protein